MIRLRQSQRTPNRKLNLFCVLPSGATLAAASGVPARLSHRLTQPHRLLRLILRLASNSRPAVRPIFMLAGIASRDMTANCPRYRYHGLRWYRSGRFSRRSVVVNPVSCRTRSRTPSNRLPNPLMLCVIACGERASAVPHVRRGR